MNRREVHGGTAAEARLRRDLGDRSLLPQQELDLGHQRRNELAVAAHGLADAVLPVGEGRYRSADQDVAHARPLKASARVA